MPSPNKSLCRRVAVIGGGITGLAAAHRLVELNPALEVALLEAGDRLGGLLQSERQAGYLLELGADNFITNVPWALDLCRRIGFAGELVETRPTHRRALVVRGGKLYPVPEGFLLLAPGRLWPLVASPVLSLAGKLRLACEWFVPRRASEADESLASFARRRLGREVFERLVEPLAAGIYTADAERLSMAAALPRYWEMERRHGSLWRAARREAAGQARASGARYSLFVAPRAGLASLAAAIARRLPPGTVELNSPVERVVPRPGGGWSVWVAGGAAAREFDAVIVATPAPHARRLLGEADRELAAGLEAIRYATSAVVLAGYGRQQISHRLDGFGFVVPQIEGRPILAASFASVKFPGRAPDGRVLVRVFLGGAARPQLVELPDDRIQQIVSEELAGLLRIRGEPEFWRVCRWERAMPQYDLGHLARVERIEARASALGNLQLAGSAYHGVGIPHCIHSGEQAAQKLAGIGRL